MIQFTITLTEENGGVHIKSESPDAPTATQAEIQVALKLSEKIKFWINSPDAKVKLKPEKGRIIPGRIPPPGWDKFREGPGGN